MQSVLTIKKLGHILLMALSFPSCSTQKSNAMILLSYNFSKRVLMLRVSAHHTSLEEKLLILSVFCPTTSPSLPHSLLCVRFICFND